MVARRLPGIRHPFAGADIMRNFRAMRSLAILATFGLTSWAGYHLALGLLGPVGEPPARESAALQPEGALTTGPSLRERAARVRDERLAIETLRASRTNVGAMAPVPSPESMPATPAAYARVSLSLRIGDAPADLVLDPELYEVGSHGELTGIAALGETTERAFGSSREITASFDIVHPGRYRVAWHAQTEQGSGRGQGRDLVIVSAGEHPTVIELSNDELGCELGDPCCVATTEASLQDGE
ncbi:MAG: hypothetical protein KDC95_12030 [Planctomycetes bacterium]|nr:hypothetical protein [Planctomycetota bacterium]